MKRLLLVSIATLFLAPGTARAHECDTEHTSDLRNIWQCGKICVTTHGPPLNRSLSIDDFVQGESGGGSIDFRFKYSKGKATLNGKQCKSLPQTYLLDQEQK
jgi:hypothetical protein